MFRLIQLLIFAVTAILLAVQSSRANSGNHTIHNFDRFIALRDDSRTRKFDDKLKVNLRADIRHVVPNKCETRGEIELMQLASTEVMEEAYAYIPSLCLWIEVGYDESKTSVRLDSKFVARLLKNFDQLIIYHIHMGESSKVAGYFPAYNDLISLILVNGRFFRNPEIQISHRAITKVGVIDYKIRISQEANHLIDKLKQTGLGEFIAQNLAFFFARDKYENRYYTEIRECGLLIGENSDKLSKCFPMKTDVFELEFRTLNAINTADFRK